MAKRLDDTEALSTQAANDLSEKKKIIQEQEKLIEKNKRRVAVMHLFPKIRKFCQLKKSLDGKSGLIQIWRKGLRKMRRYHLEQWKSRVRSRKSFKSKLRK